MLFNSVTFLFYFFPIFLIFYFSTRGIYRNLVLLLFSIFFYMWGDVSYVLLFVFSMVISFIGGLLIDKFKDSKYQFWILMFFISIHAIMFFKLKYLSFVVTALNSIVNSNVSVQDTILPIGISFYTFQIISYLIDVYNNKTKVQHNFIIYGSYISMFSQLIAGPIIRYEEIEDDLINNKFNLERFNKGVHLFVQGLFLKVVLADSFSFVITEIQKVNPNDQYVTLLWLMVILYTLQIFLDFNGYSKMARGLGNMMGYEFAMNFNFPYSATSVSDFWRRWHMTLTRWFKDYVYIPLGGSRGSYLKTFRNILVVWLFTGIWHGAGYTFIIWGLWNFIWIYAEKEMKFLQRLPKIVGNIYTILVVMIGWVFFMSPDISYSIDVISGLFLGNGTGFYTPWALGFVKQYKFELLIALMYSYNLFGGIEAKLYDRSMSIVVELTHIFMLFISVIYIVTQTASPFLYFNF